MPVQVQATHCITLEDVTAWLADHGVSVDDVDEAVIRVDRREHDRISAWLEVSYFLRNVDGNRFADETGENAARGTATIPLHSWPALTSV